MFESHTHKQGDFLMAQPDSTMGSVSAFSFADDPRRLGFVLARYKFVAKVLAGMESVLEVGCGGGFGTTVVAQEVGQVTAIDINPERIEARATNRWLDKVDFRCEDILDNPKWENCFDAAFSLDVIEHVDPEKDALFFVNILRTLKAKSTLIIGTPNKTADAFHKGDDHINLKTHVQLHDDLTAHFEYVLMFGMNDEMLHTGFAPMCHYLFGIGMHPKD